MPFSISQNRRGPVEVKAEKYECKATNSQGVYLNLL